MLSGLSPKKMDSGEDYEEQRRKKIAYNNARLEAAGFYKDLEDFRNLSKEASLAKTKPSSIPEHKSGTNCKPRRSERISNLPVHNTQPGAAVMDGGDSKAASLRAQQKEWLNESEAKKDYEENQEDTDQFLERAADPPYNWKMDTKPTFLKGLKRGEDATIYE
jgi:hypothetical protein